MPRTAVGIGASPAFRRRGLWLPSYDPDLHGWWRSDLGITAAAPATVLADGDMEAVGTGSWSAINAALTKELGAPQAGLRSIRLTYTSSALMSIRQDNTTVIGKEYRILGYAKGSGGAAYPRVLDGNGVVLWTGTNSTSWQPFDVTYTAAFAHARFYGWDTAPGEYVEFDSITQTPTDALNVSAWANQKPGGTDAVQPTVNSQPSYLASGGISSHPGVEFDGINEFLSISGDSNASNDFTVIAVANVRSLAPAARYFLQYTAQSLVPAAVRSLTNSIGGYDGTAWRDVAPAATGDQALEYHWNSTALSLECFRNGASLGTAAYDGTLGIGGANAAIGSSPTGTTYHMDAILCELIMIADKRTAAQLAPMRAYLSARYGL